MHENSFHSIFLSALGSLIVIFFKNILIWQEKNETSLLF